MEAKTPPFSKNRVAPAVGRGMTLHGLQAQLGQTLVQEGAKRLIIDVYPTTRVQFLTREVPRRQLNHREQNDEFPDEEKTT
jgi:hypothetical protein